MSDNSRSVMALDAETVHTAAELLRDWQNPDSPITFVLAGDVKVGSTRIYGGVVTAVEVSKSGKTVKVTDDKIGTESLSSQTRITIVKAV